MHRLAVTMLVLVAAVAGCGAPTSPPDVPSEDAPDYTEVDTLTPVAAGTIGVGDIEFDTRVEVRVDPRSVRNNVRIDEAESEMDRLTRMTADVFPPYPEEFWLHVSVFVRQNFPDHTTHFTTTLYVDNEPVLEFAHVGGDKMTEPEERSFNLFEHTGGPKDSILVVAQTDLQFYKDTDEATIPVDNPPPVTADAKATVSSNALRIRFRE